MSDNCVPVDDFVGAGCKEVLAQQHAVKPAGTDPFCGRAATLVGAMIQFLHEHYADPDLSLAELSRKVNVSERHLARLFQSHAGKSFCGYLIDLRMKAAAELLAGSPLDIKEIAGRVGYNGPSNFIKYFRIHAGCTPREFRAGCCKCTKAHSNE